MENVIKSNFKNIKSRNLLYHLPDIRQVNYVLNLLDYFRKHKRMPSHRFNDLNDYIFFVKNNKHSCANGYFADKIEMKTFIKSLFGEDYITPILKVFNAKEDLKDFDCDEAYVLKPSHMSGEVIIKKKGGKLTKEELKIAEKWFKLSYFNYTREYIYKNIQPRVFAEKMLIDKNEVPKDYKFFCFNNKAEFIQEDISRFSNHLRDFYDRNWNKIDMQVFYPNSPSKVAKPHNFEEALAMADKLACLFPFVRVDFYISESFGIKFGELTFCPSNSLEAIKINCPDFKKKYRKLLRSLS